MARAGLAKRREAEVLPGALADRLARVAWLCAHAHGLGIDDVIDPPPFNPKATRARLMAIAIAARVTRCGPESLGLYFEDSADAMAMACAHAAARCKSEPEFRTTMRFLTSACA